MSTSGEASGLVRVGFVGCGNHATENLYPALRHAACKLVAVADPDESRREHNARVFGAERAYADFTPMLDSEELDAVFVCGPPKLHYAAGRAALERGLHVFTEKPPAASLDESIELAAIARERNRVCAVGLMKRCAQKYAQAKSIIDSGEFGTLRHAFVRYSYNVEGDGAQVYPSMSIHAIDLLRFFGGPIATVDIAHTSGEHAGVICQTRSTTGVVGTLVMNASAPGVLERVELTGDGAMIVVDEVASLDYYPPQRENVWRPVRSESHRPNMALQTVENSSLEIQGYRGEVVRFIEAVASGGSTMPAATIDDAVESMRLVELLIEGHDGRFEVER